MGVIRAMKNGLDRGIETLVATLMAVLVLDVTWQVFTRYVLADPSSWTEELATFLLIWVGLLGACVALHRKAHVGIDYFVMKLPPGIRGWTECVVHLATGLFSAGVLGYGGMVLVTRTLVLDQTSPALGIQMGWVYLALPVSGFFMTLYSLEFLVQSLAALGTGRDLDAAEGS